MFTDEFDTFAFVRFGLAERADLGANLAEELLVGRFEDDEGVLVAFGLGFDFDFVGKLDEDCVRESEGEFEDLSGCCGTVSDADELHLFLVSFANANDHVVDKGAVETVLRAVLDIVGGTCYDDVSVFDFYVEIGVECLFEC